MEYVLIIAAFLLSIAGIAGCILPIPGPPLNFIGMLLLQWAFDPFRLRTLLIWTALTILVSVFDYILPSAIAKKFGATKTGIWGGLIGMLTGMFFTPVGMVAGLLIGSIIGDLIANKTLKQASIAASGNFLGTFLSVGIKLICSGWMTLLVIYRSVEYLWP